MIPKRISNKRRQMGEVAWAEHVRLRKNKKSDAWQERNIENVVKWRQKHKIRLIELALLHYNMILVPFWFLKDIAYPVLLLIVLAEWN